MLPAPMRVREVSFEYLDYFRELLQRGLVHELESTHAFQPLSIDGVKFCRGLMSTSE